MGIEKRKERRIKVGLPIKIICPGRPEISATTGNISFLGAYVETDKEVSLGADAGIILQIPEYSKDPSSSGEVRAKGNIFRCNPVRRESEVQGLFGVGIFFTGFTHKSDRDKLSRYINFLVSEEEKNLRAGVKALTKKKREKKKESAARSTLSQEEFQKEALHLLKQILSRLEKLSPPG